MPPTRTGTSNGRASTGTRQWHLGGYLQLDLRDATKHDGHAKPNDKYARANDGDTNPSEPSHLDDTTVLQLGGQLWHDPTPPHISSTDFSDTSWIPRPLTG
jgi:hypothetical protein